MVFFLTKLRTFHLPGPLRPNPRMARQNFGPSELDSIDLLPRVRDALQVPGDEAKLRALDRIGMDEATLVKLANLRGKTYRGVRQEAFRRLGRIERCAPNTGALMQLARSDGPVEKRLDAVRNMSADPQALEMLAIDITEPRIGVCIVKMTAGGMNTDRTAPSGRMEMLIRIAGRSVCAETKRAVIHAFETAANLTALRTIASSPSVHTDIRGEATLAVRRLEQKLPG